VIADFTGGRGSEPEASDYVTEMMIAKFVKEHKMSLVDFEEKMDVAKIVERSGFDKFDLLSLTAAMEGVDPRGIKEYVGTVERMRKMEVESNITADKVYDKVVESREELGKINKEILKSNKELENLKGRLATERDAYESLKREVDFSKKLRSVTEGLSDDAVLSLLTELKSAGLEGQSLIRFGRDLEKIRDMGESLDHLLISTGVLIDAHSRGFATEEIRDIGAELKEKGITLREMIDLAMKWSKDSEILNEEYMSLQEERKKLVAASEELRNRINDYKRDEEKLKSSR
jgi:chromosome segregation ATPase